jgi:uncharacterized protein (UPF0261 family)
VATVVLLGTLDTKGDEYAYLRSLLEGHGVETILIDAGVLGEPRVAPDVTREEVARAAGSTPKGGSTASSRSGARAEPPSPPRR